MSHICIYSFFVCVFENKIRMNEKWKQAIQEKETHRMVKAGRQEFNYFFKLS